MAEQLVSQKIAAHLKQSQYENTVIDFVQKENGCFIAVTDDSTFMGVLRAVLNKDLALGALDLLITVQDSEQIIKVVKDTDAAGRIPMLFIERRFKEQDAAPIIQQLKNTFPKTLIIVLTTDIQKHRIMYLHEIGADNFIAKPVSANTVVEKMAFTIKPQSKLGQLIDAGKAYLVEGNPKKAKEIALQVLEMKPGSAAGLMVLGDAEMALGDSTAAKAAYQEACNNADMYLEPLRRLAQLAEKTGNLEEALEHLEQLDRLSPLNSERKITMGEINLNLGNEDKAHELFDKAIAQVSKEAMDHISSVAERVATIYAAVDPAKSEVFLRKALNAKTRYLSREDLRLFNQLGVSLRKQGKHMEAIEEYKSALKIDAKNTATLYNMGMAYHEANLLPEAGKCMEKALELNEQILYSSPNVAYNMGVILAKTNAKAKAKQCFEAALAQAPDMKQAIVALEKI